MFNTKTLLSKISKLNWNQNKSYPWLKIVQSVSLFILKSHLSNQTEVFSDFVRLNKERKHETGVKVGRTTKASGTTWLHKLNN